MKKYLVSIALLLLVFQMVAQTNYVIINETKVNDVDLYKKNYPAVRNWWMKEAGDIAYNRAGHQSETGRIYKMVFLKSNYVFSSSR